MLLDLFLMLVSRQRSISIGGFSRLSLALFFCFSAFWHKVIYYGLKTMPFVELPKR